MMNEEEYIKERMGKKSPFTVPDGYFEQLSDRIMSRLEESQNGETTVAREASLSSEASSAKKPGSSSRRLRPWLAAAGIAAVAVISATLFFGKEGAITTGQDADESLTAFYDDNYINEEADYAMVDNQDIYAFLLADI